MPRDASGTYTLPNSPFVTQTVIASTVTNGNFSDIAIALTQSLATTGVSTMTGRMQGFAGTVTAPGYASVLNPDTGFYRVSANVFGFAAAGVETFTLSSAGIIMQNSANFIDPKGNVVLAVPIGTIFDYGGTTAPTGWLFCYGQSVAQATYAALFTLIGTTYGAAGGGNFTLPDLRGRVTATFDSLGGTPAGRLTGNASNGVDGSAMGNSGGLQNLTLTQGMFPVFNLTNNLTITIGPHTINQSNANIGPAGPSAGSVIAASLTNPTTAGSVTGTVTSGGSGTTLNTVQPTLMVTKIIFTGVVTT